MRLLALQGARRRGWPSLSGRAHMPLFPHRPQVDLERHFQELEQLLLGINMLQELTPRARDCLVSFGERLSTRIFAALLNKLGVAARQFDAYKIGVVTTGKDTWLGLVPARASSVCTHVPVMRNSNPAR